jgi:hypothetical protein
MNAMEANLTLSDIQGRTVWTGHRTGSALRGGQQSFAIGTAHGALPSGTYLLSAKIKNVAGAVVAVERKVSTVN